MRFPKYTLGYAALSLAAAPYYLGRGLVTGKYLWNISERMGRAGLDLKPKSDRPRVLIHALSLGETLSIVSLAEALAGRGYEVCLSATTRSGYQAALDKAPLDVPVLQFPFDWPPAVRRFQNAVRPDLFVLAETDIWPNFLDRLNRTGVPAVLINARVSDRSFSRLRLVKGWWEEVLNLFAYIGVQTGADHRRMIELGADMGKVEVTGNLKFDRPAPETGPDVRRALLSETGLPDGLWLVGGSTHPGEEQALLEIFLKLRPRFPELRLLLVPRDETRFEAVWRMIQSLRLEAARRTGDRPGPGTEVFLLDTQGELDRFYELADLVFIGKSLPGPHEGGGHNPLEPAARGKPVLFGPRMDNFREIASLMLRGGGAVQAADRSGLEAALESLLANPRRRLALGRSALAVVEAHRGALRRTLNLIDRAFREGG